MSQSACIVEMKKLSEKLRRAYQRRDHYAQLYYRVLAELEDTKWELELAKKKIQELKLQGIIYTIMGNSLLWIHEKLVCCEVELCLHSCWYI